MLKVCRRIALKKVEQKNEHSKKDFDCYVIFAQHLYCGRDNNDSITEDKRIDKDNSVF